MKSLGERLKEAREAKEISLDTASEDTNIALRYLSAIEENNYDSFHSEIYLLGFLKTYADYLDFSVEKALNLYRNYKVSEEDAPLAKLMDVHRKEINYIQLALFVVAIIVCLALFVLAIITIKNGNKDKPESVKVSNNNSSNNSNSKTRSSKIFEMSSSSLDEVLQVGDRLQVNYANKVYDFIYKSPSADGSYKFEQFDIIEQVSISTFDLKLNNEQFFKLGNTDQVDFLINVLEVGVGDVNNLKVHFEYLNNSIVYNNVTLVESNEMQGSEERLNTPALKTLDINASTVLLSEKNPSNIDIQFTFKGDAYFRVTINNEENIERYFEEGEQILRNMKSKIRLGSSNADRVRLKVGNTEISLGRSGEIVVKDIHWRRNNKNGMWELLLEDAK